MVPIQMAQFGDDRYLIQTILKCILKRDILFIISQFIIILGT